MPAAESDFAAATQSLPVSEDRAVARFKLADTQFRQTNYASAVTNYQLLVRNYSKHRRITNSLFEPALYQTLRAQFGNRKHGRGYRSDAQIARLVSEWFVGRPQRFARGRKFEPRRQGSRGARDCFRLF